MDKLSVNQKRGAKQAKSKRKAPLKVVYISSPMKFETSAAKFRELVQSVTGQDSDIDSLLGFHESSTTVDVKVSLPAQPDSVNHVVEINHGGVNDGLGFGTEGSPWPSMFDESPVMYDTPASVSGAAITFRAFD